MIERVEGIEKWAVDIPLLNDGLFCSECLIQENIPK
jgi:hypothetical protein